MNTERELRKNDILMAKALCIVEGETAFSLTIGKHYRIKELVKGGREIVIVDDQEVDHIFTTYDDTADDSWCKWFDYVGRDLALFIDLDAWNEERMEFVFGQFDKLNIPRPVFNMTFDNASDDISALLHLLQIHDQIYADTYLTGDYGVTPATVFNTLMYKADELGIKGKTVRIMNPSAEIHWDGLRATLVDRAFKDNYLYTFEADGWQQVDIDTMLRENKFQG